jgi:acetylcholinesterase
MAEECLSINIWTPSWTLIPHQSERLPVIIFIHGGQFTVGGSRVAYHLPHRWVERSQRHLVVTFKFVLLSIDSFLTPT